MKRFQLPFGWPLAMVVGLAIEARALDIDLARFTDAKAAQARELARALTNTVPSMVWSFFDAVRVDDWQTATNLAFRIEKAGGRIYHDDVAYPSLQTTLWMPVHETLGAYEQFHEWDHKWLHRFGNDVIGSIPPGSIYFGGTDPGRFIISALSESHRDGRPFFTLTQNQLADGRYLEFLRKMYGNRLFIPSADEARKTFEYYVTDADRRRKAGQLKPGENIRVSENGKVEVSGQVAVMEVSALLAKLIFEKNPTRQFYIEESFPLDWMYPHLSPHGLILALHSRPLAALPPAEVQKDQKFWKRWTGELIGDWIDEKTSVRDLCEFCDTVYLRKDLAGFKGDAAFAKSEAIQRTFSKLRTAIAGVYVWRAGQAKDEEEKNRMRNAADLALRQAFALCPYSPETVYHFCKLLEDQHRPDDAILVGQTCLRFDPENAYVRNLVRILRKAE